MGKNGGNGKLPSFSPRPGGQLSRVEADMAEKATENADKMGTVGDPEGGVIPAQHCSHGSHGSHGSW